MRKLKLTNYVLGFALIFGISCGKYEYGPNFSLRTKKERLDGNWFIQKIIWPNGTEETFANDSTEILFISKTGVGEFITDNGTGIIETTLFSWEFTDKKTKLKLTVEENGETEITTYTILRLTNKEFWVDQNDDNRKAEIHFQAK